MKIGIILGRYPTETGQSF